jgi:hypothetical protein
MKVAPERLTMLNEMYERAFEYAASTDNDGVTLRIRPTGMNLN